MELLLHREMKAFVTTETTFHELFEYINRLIAAHGYINLDFLGNLGHSIVKSKKKSHLYGKRQPCKVILR